ncbi:helix-turn-helix domain-containing protein [Streptomyces sp. p1417]|uniref:Helix-turn-helix domain-containing protein n=1 Tax=Streptomyces typhae TaxID=2681492 RepID=A0A6L6WU92_9ACTN|nr:helix-turn-helix domain-containing protein [Streptomyces typhae]
MKRGHTPPHEGGAAAPPGRSVLEGAFLLLEELARRGDAGLTDLAAGTGLPKATAHRLLDQLAALGAVERRSGRYRIGAAVAHLARSWGTAHPLSRAAAQPLRGLSAATGTSAAVVAPVGGSMVVVSGLPGPSDEMFPLMPGLILPPGSGAEAVISASGPATAPPPAYSAAEWARRLSRVRERGVDLHRYGNGGDGGNGAATSCLAAPVHDPTGRAVAAIGVCFPGHRNPPATAADAARRAARMLSANLARLPRARKA